MHSTVKIDWFTGVSRHAQTHPFPLEQHSFTFVPCPGWSGYDVGEREIDTGVKRFSSTTRPDMGYAVVVSATALSELARVHEENDMLGAVWRFGCREYRATRLDLAVDVFDGGVLAQKVARSARRDVIRTNARRISVIESTRGGTGVTTYIGSRQAARFMRVYDKNAESNGKIPASRFELQANKDFAEQLWRSIDAPLQSALNTTAYASINGLVQSWGDETVNKELSFILDAKPAPKQDSDAEKWEWIKKQVFPTYVRDWFLADDKEKTLLYKTMEGILGGDIEKIVEFNFWLSEHLYKLKHGE